MDIARPPRIAVALASLGRPDILAVAVRHMKAQSRRPDRIVLSVVSDADLPREPDVLRDVEIVKGPAGLTNQRNAALDVLEKDCDLIVFYDDDFIPSRYSLERIIAFFEANPEVGGATGLVLADGIYNAGVSETEAERIVSAHDARIEAPDLKVIHHLSGLYGCNMAYRASMIAGERFDTRLALYGWQEDIDFAARIAKRGWIVKSHAFTGVHMGTKTGRSPGRRFGYSQVINPLYMAAKGTMAWSYALKLVSKNVVANHLRAFSPEPWIDRAGRVRGNWIALRHLLMGRLEPERVADIGK